MQRVPGWRLFSIVPVEPEGFEGREQEDEPRDADQGMGVRMMDPLIHLCPPKITYSVNIRNKVSQG